MASPKLPLSAFWRESQVLPAKITDAIPKDPQNASVRLSLLDGIVV